MSKLCIYIDCYWQERQCYKHKVQAQGYSHRARRWPIILDNTSCVATLTVHLNGDSSSNWQQSGNVFVLQDEIRACDGFRVANLNHAKSSWTFEHVQTISNAISILLVTYGFSNILKQTFAIVLRVSVVFSKSCWLSLTNWLVASDRTLSIGVAWA